MNSPASLRERRAISDDDLNARREAAIARTRVLLKCSRAIRAATRSQYTLPFTPRCADCQQAGRTHDFPLTSEQHYICTRCRARWSVEASDI